METIQPELLGFSASRLGRIQTVMQDYVDRRKIAGAVTLVARRGKVAHSGACGGMGLEPNPPMRRDAIFRIFSMSKPITCAAAMTLFEEGRFRLTDPLADYLPAFKEMKVAQPRGVDIDLVPAQRPITIRDLFTHTSGLSYGFEPLSWLDDLYRRKIWGMTRDYCELSLAEASRGVLQAPAEQPVLETFVERLAGMPLAHQPGSAFRYSFAIDVLGRLIEVVSGKPFDVFLSERIFDPLGMADTGFWVPPEKAERFTAVVGPDLQGGLTEYDAAQGSTYTRPPVFLSGGGGMVSTAEDYLRFCQMLLNGGELGGERLLGRKTVDLMFSDHLPPGAVFTDPSYGVGLGGAVLVNPARWGWLGTAGRWAWGGAANTEFFIDRREELVGVLMLQFMPAGLYPIEADFNNMVYQALVDETIKAEFSPQRAQRE